MKNLLSLREKEIFNTLKTIKEHEFVVIGGYAANTYTLPRFSIDCDIVTKNQEETQKIENNLKKQGYKKTTPKNEQYTGRFTRLEKTLEKNFKVSIDILTAEVTDRITNTKFTAKWIFENSKKRMLKGKTIIEQIKTRIINIDALIVMKIISCRNTDIRDVFMMLPNTESKKWIKQEVSKRYNLKERTQKIINKTNETQFKDGLAGVYGKINNKTYEKHTKAIQELTQ